MTGTALWATVLVASFGVGLVVTVTALRIRAARAQDQMTAQLAAGAISWGAQARESLSSRRWGFSGRLTLTPDGVLTFVPDSSSVKRGAREESWPVQGARISLGPRKRDALSGQVPQSG
jgi:hypothetical protein